MSHRSVQRKVSSRLPTAYGEFALHLYWTEQDDKEHLALVKGNPDGASRVLVRIHSECFTGDVLGSTRCDCGDQLGQSLQRIQGEECGMILYLRQEGRGIGLSEKLRAYNLQDLGYDTVAANNVLGHPADNRDYTMAAEMLRDLGVHAVSLLTNNPAKVRSLVNAGIEVTEQISMTSAVTAENADYLMTKVRRMQHQIDLAGLVEAASKLRAEEPGTAATFRSYEIAVADAREQSSAIGAMLGQSVDTADDDSPFVTLTYAQSIDGCIAAKPGEPLVLSGQQSLQLTHRLRAAHDAILVGVGTVLADDPRLTARPPEAGNGHYDPRVIVLDSQLRTPQDAKILSGAPWIFAAPDASVRRQALLEEKGARVFRVVAKKTGLDLQAVLAELAAAGIGSLMVEGGARVITSFLESQLADQLILTVAPRMVGGLQALQSCLTLPPLRNPRYQQMGEDLIIWSALDRESLTDSAS